MTFVVQYLEDSPYVRHITPTEARDRLRGALAQLPISRVLVGWNVPESVLAACVDEATRAGTRVLRWHPLLSGDGVFVPRSQWRVIGLDGAPVPGYKGMSAFTFVCPNRPAARAAVLAHLRDAVDERPYGGVFLDRMRYPSPAEGPERFLGCFCEACRRRAAEEGVELEAVRRHVQALITTPDGARAYVRVLLDPDTPTAHDPHLVHLRAFLDFRRRSVTHFLRQVCHVIRDAGLEVGLDAFSPGLTYSVGQDLPALMPDADWVKVMTYGHTYAPAGVPFELLGLVDWLIERGASARAAVETLAQALRLPLPSTRAGLQARGLGPEALAAEIRRARTLRVRPLLAGIELVDHAVTRLDAAQIAADVQAVHAAGADGLVLSWDLWHIPLARLELVGAHFGDG